MVEEPLSGREAAQRLRLPFKTKSDHSVDEAFSLPVLSLHSSYPLSEQL